ncbi:MAG: hypothetical protein ABIX46_12275 [Burkholderiaceae bacterium]
MAEFPDRKGHEVYVCGSVRMVEAAIPAFIAPGAEEDFCFFVAFMPSARPGGSRRCRLNAGDEHRRTIAPRRYRRAVRHPATRAAIDLAHAAQPPALRQSPALL